MFLMKVLMVTNVIVKKFFANTRKKSVGSIEFPIGLIMCKFLNKACCCIISVNERCQVPKFKGC